MTLKLEVPAAGSPASSEKKETLGDIKIAESLPPTSPPPPKRGRPRKEICPYCGKVQKQLAYHLAHCTAKAAADSAGKPEPPPAPGPEIPLALLSGLVAMPFEYLSDRRGKLWSLTAKEQEHLASTTKALLDFYLPMLAGYGPLVAFAGSLVMVIGPRIIADAWQARNKDSGGKSRERKEPDAQGPVSRFDSEPSDRLPGRAF